MEAALDSLGAELTQPLRGPWSLAARADYDPARRSWRDLEVQLGRTMGIARFRAVLDLEFEEFYLELVNRL